jgi:hypothetical protein
MHKARSLNMRSRGSRMYFQNSCIVFALSSGALDASASRCEARVTLLTHIVRSAGIATWKQSHLNVVNIHVALFLRVHADTHKVTETIVTLNSCVCSTS